MHTHAHTQEFDGCFTSYNMEPTLSSDNVWGFRYLNDDTTGACNSKMVEAIENAQESIDIAHTYFRSEVVYDAVMRRVQDGIHVRVINDGKEFRNSNNLPIELSEEGADVRFKYYARGWDFGCAQQMHMKFFLIDANLALEGKCVVITGSENLSDGSEKRTFENVIFSRSPWVCEEYKNQFAKLRSYGVQSNENRTSAVQRYNDEATCFFSPITLSGQEIKDLRNSIDCRLRVGEYDGNFPEGECTFWGDHRPVLCFQSWYAQLFFASLTFYYYISLFLDLGAVIALSLSLFFFLDDGALIAFSLFFLSLLHTRTYIYTTHNKTQVQRALSKSVFFLSFLFLSPHPPIYIINNKTYF